MTKLVDGRYELIEVIGSGGMATVWRARDRKLDREVALKRPHPLPPGDPRVECLTREARLAASVSHPHLVTVHDAGADDDGLYLVLELVEAPSLADVGPSLETDQILEVGVHLARALGAVHRAGVVHRDVKPSNILLPPGGAKLTDFGIAVNTPVSARPSGAWDTTAVTSRLTEPGTVIATADYAAPEVLHGQPATPASDIYSLGMVLAPYLDRERLVGPELDRLMVRVLSANPADRPQADELAVELHRAQQYLLERRRADRTMVLPAGSAHAGPGTGFAGAHSDNGSYSSSATGYPGTGRVRAAEITMVDPGDTDRIPFNPSLGSAARAGTYSSHSAMAPRDGTAAGLTPEGAGRRLGPVLVFALMLVAGFVVVNLLSAAAGNWPGLDGLGRSRAPGPGNEEAGGDSADSAPEAPTTVTVPTPDGSLSGSNREADEGVESSSSPEGTGSDDGADQGPLSELFQPLRDVEQAVASAVEAGQHRRRQLEAARDVLKKVSEATELARDGELEEATKRLEGAAKKVDKAFDGRERQEAFDTLQKVADQLGLEEFELPD